ncbi:MAG: AAA family ATPase, partial [Lachnospiraceae bacterium]|nr:AAA family ATPase [Lachnospiraceae bacterium]
MGYDRKPLPVGVDDFEKLVTRGYYFIDKTNFMRDLLELKGDVNLFTRPRRFGKTLNMSMLQYFFEDMRDEIGGKIDHSGLFEGLNIMQADKTYLSHMGKYPVINMTLKAGKRPTFESACTQIGWQIAMEYDRHRYVLDVLSEAEKSKYRCIMEQRASIDDYCSSLQFLSQCLQKYYGRKTIILIDEYDVPLENAYLRGFYQQMVDFVRSFFEAALKTNNSLEFAVVTGCLRISKESIFTGLNNLKTISILDEKYDEYFGFTDDEVRKMCGDFQLPDKYDTFKNWYNGYIFGRANVYNPWSVIQFMDDLKQNPDWFPRSYWANTSSNSIVRKLIERADDSVKGEIEHLIDGGTIEKPVHEDITYG